jgi:hypothetical protein
MTSGNFLRDRDASRCLTGPVFDLMTRPFQRPRMVWLALIGAVVLLLALMVAMQAPRAELLTRAPGTPNPRLSFLGGWGGPVRSTLRNLRFKWFGPPRTVAISAEVFECYESFSLAKDSLSAPLAVDPSATRLWLIDTNQWAVLRANLQSNAVAIARPSAWTADGHPANMFTGESALIDGSWRRMGLAFDVSTQTKSSAVDLTAFFTLTSAFTNASLLTNAVSVRTNLAAGARVQIPRDHRLFLLTSNAANGKRIGVIVSAAIHEPQK